MLEVERALYLLENFRSTVTIRLVTVEERVELVTVASFKSSKLVYQHLIQLKSDLSLSSLIKKMNSDH